MIKIGYNYNMYILNPYIYGAAAGTSYLLDDYSAAAAYSLRQLKTGVTNVVRVRRSSDNAEADFTATEITDGTLTTWTGANDGFITAWFDQSGNGAGYGVSQSTAANQAKLVSSGVVITKGGLPAAQFDGSGDHYQRSSNLPATLGESSYFSVTASDTLSAYSIISQYSTTDSNRYAVFHDTRNTPTRNLVIQQSGSTYTADLSAARNNTDQRLLSSFVDSSFNMSAFDNGTTGGTDTAGSTISPSVLYIGRQASGLYFSGYFQEWINFTTDESANRTAIESDINTHYSIY